MYLLESALIRPELMRASSGKGGIVLEGSAEGFASLMYVIDPKTYLPTSVTVVPPAVVVPEKPAPVPGAPVQYAIQSYAVVDGIQMPRVIKGVGTLSFLINPELDPSLFETPPDGVTSRDAWRKYLRR